jgi:NhaP-type Na+/H+ or K+/H+ antiporter
MEHYYLLLFVLLSVAAVGAQWLAWRLNLPAIVVLLGAGFLIGPVAGIFDPWEDFGALLRPAISLAVAVVVLEGGLSLNFAELRAAGRGILRLIVIGVPLVWGFGTLAADAIAGISWPVSLLLGAMLVITGPTVITPLLRQAKLNKRTAAFLKWEGVLNDAIGAVLSVLVLEFLFSLAAAREVERTLWQTLGSLALGAAAGVALGIGAAFLLRFLFARNLAPEFLKAPMVLAAALLIYGVADLVLAEAGLIAVAMLGIGLANMGLPEIEDLKRFKGALTVFLVGGLFIVLTAGLRIEDFVRLSWPALAFIAAMLFVVRPLAIFLSTIGAGMSWQERLFVAFIAPRGIVVAALAGLAGTRLQSVGYADAELIVPLVFSVIIATVVLHGLAIGPLARRLGLAAEARPGVLIVGANRWTAALAKALRDMEVPVMLSDRPAAALAEAEWLDLPRHEGHLLAPREDDPEQLKDFEVLLAATEDPAFNALVCLRFASELGQQHVYQTAFAEPKDGLDLNREWRGKILADTELRLEDLCRRIDAGWRFQAEPLAGRELAEALRVEPERRVPVLVRRPTGEILLTSPEGNMPARMEGEVLVFQAPGGLGAAEVGNVPAGAAARAA